MFSFDARARRGQYLFIMNKHNASKIVSASVGQQKSKKPLFGLSVEELKMVTGGGGVIIEQPVFTPPPPVVITAVPLDSIVSKP